MQLVSRAVLITAVLVSTSKCYHRLRAHCCLIVLSDLIWHAHLLLIRWVRALEEEFFRQGDSEKAAGLPISLLFDRAKPGVTKSQVGFFDIIILPLFQVRACSQLCARHAL